MNLILTTCVMIAAVAANDGDLISGKVIVALFSAIFAAGGGIWIGRKGGTEAAEKSWAKRESDLRAEIANELKTRIVNEPLSIEQSAYQAAMKENSKEHSNLFARLNAVEKQLAELSGATNAKLESLKEQLVETKAMVAQLFDRICKGGRK